ncbi:hypothetical protein CDAR_196471 [Caerostris darwini]|uniref:Uncharacterized protein n=1 Tax=Caerostris darwini TaxID=1538125 RepID=A0AAV4PWI2_9ARAC|nr:hypothetical protein CDAR_196471 [Caerostris darwini]
MNYNLFYFKTSLNLGRGKCPEKLGDPCDTSPLGFNSWPNVKFACRKAQARIWWPCPLKSLTLGPMVCLNAKRASFGQLLPNNRF